MAIVTAASFTLSLPNSSGTNVNWVFDPVRVADGYAEWRASSIDGTACPKGAMDPMIAVSWTAATAKQPKPQYTCVFDFPVLGTNGVTDTLMVVDRVRGELRFKAGAFRDANTSDVQRAGEAVVAALAASLNNSSFALAAVINARSQYR